MYSAGTCCERAGGHRSRLSVRHRLATSHATNSDIRQARVSRTTLGVRVAWEWLCPVSALSVGPSQDISAGAT